MQVKLTKTVCDFSGNAYPEGAVLEARISVEGTAIEVVGAQYMSLYPDEWETVLTDEDFERLLNG